MPCLVISRSVSSSKASSCDEAKSIAVGPSLAPARSLVVASKGIGTIAIYAMSLL